MPISDPRSRSRSAGSSTSEAGSSLSTGCRAAATPPANPSPNGIGSTRPSGSPSEDARSSSWPFSARKIVAASAPTTSFTRATRSGRMSAMVRCASAASTSSCIPLTISATRSASARAACSPSSASRSLRRRIRSVRSRTNAESITSSPTRTRWMVSSAGNVVPSRRLSSTSTCITFSGSGASISSLTRFSCSSRPVLREDHLAQRAADRLGRRPAEQPLGGGVPGRDQPGAGRRSRRTRPAPCRAAA